MNRLRSLSAYHIAYWLLVILVLTLVFGLRWENKLAAFLFICMLSPIVLGTSYFFNDVLVPRYFMQRKYGRFALYAFYTLVLSLYLEVLVIVFAFVYLGNYNIHRLGPNISNIFLLAALLYLLVFLGSFLFLSRQLRENQEKIRQLVREKEKMTTPYLELLSNRKVVKIPYQEIVYIESLADYIRVHSTNGMVISKEKISALETRLPETFLRIHRSFIINTDRLRTYAYNEVVVEDVVLTIGRTYRKQCKEVLKNES